MIREWGTVFEWRDGVALVSCDVKSSCSSCASRSGCGTRLLNKLGPQNEHHIQVSWPEPLQVGQKVELGITERSLLSSALLVYMLPLAGLFIMGGLFQALFSSDIAAFCGALLGGVGGFLVARGWAAKFSKQSAWQPVILSVGIPGISQVTDAQEV
ncbi:SoxR reducing system protein RseC [Salmonella enterica subsp. enterica serovar Choleraesuis]|nr:SoxR reducing system protein RseC [Salmonella enterica subsp. enterica serovar Choleraesuis]